VSLDAPKSDAELLAMLAQKQGAPRLPAVLLPDTDWPLRLRIPWSCLISDNALYLTRGGKRFKTPEYREAQKRIQALATDAMDGRPKADCPLVITFTFYVPNTQHRDVHNFIAGLADSLKGVVFTDDHWLHRGGWTHAGRDIDAPRCELTITPL
jgi:Holliday junction resolvase RusA-like endonuclease